MPRSRRKSNRRNRNTYKSRTKVLPAKKRSFVAKNLISSSVYTLKYHPAAIRPQTKRVRATPAKIVVHQAIKTKPRASKRPGHPLRLTVHPSECTRRKEYKKTMLRKIAAQQGRNLKSWRKNRRASEPTISYRC